MSPWIRRAIPGRKQAAKLVSTEEGFNKEQVSSSPCWPPSGVASAEPVQSRSPRVRMCMCITCYIPVRNHETEQGPKRARRLWCGLYHCVGHQLLDACSARRIGRLVIVSLFLDQVPYSTNSINRQQSYGTISKVVAVNRSKGYLKNLHITNR